jgi:type III pantothenate kinase
MSNTSNSSWLALVIGNSRLHWGLFSGSTLDKTWDTAHLPPELIALPCDLTHHELWLASVVPTQTEVWRHLPHARVIELRHIPIPNLYPTLGIDRALTLWSAIELWGTPVLVIDAGTAMTFTGANAQGELVGGAIAPGLQLQLRSLSQQTAALPAVEFRTDESLPDRWSQTTLNAIRSGAIYTALASIQGFADAWLQDFPGGAIALTGGDAAFLMQALQQLKPTLAFQIVHDPHLIFRSIPTIRNNFRVP